MAGTKAQMVKYGHTMTQMCSDFWHEFLTSIVQGAHMEPKWQEFEVGMVLDLEPSEIEVPLTPGTSHGTKIFGLENLSYDVDTKLF